MRDEISDALVRWLEDPRGQRVGENVWIKRITERIASPPFDVRTAKRESKYLMDTYAHVGASHLLWLILMASPDRSVYISPVLLEKHQYYGSSSYSQHYKITFSQDSDGGLLIAISEKD